MVTKKTSSKGKAKSKAKKPYANKSGGKRPPTLTQFLDGQAKINGGFYMILGSILERMGVPSKAKASPYKPLGATIDESLLKAREMVDAIPNIDPPGCQDPRGK